MQNSKLPGICYIFNHENFDGEFKNLQRRSGTKNDVILLKNTFEKFKLSVQVFHDKTVQGIKNEISEIQQKNFSNHSCIVIVILSHGTCYEQIYARDGVYSIDDDILYRISKNQTLQQKPKILLVQACKGNIDVRISRVEGHDVPIIQPVEFLKCYSTCEAFVAYHDTEGSIFIKIFCEVFNEYSMYMDIKDIMKIVIYRMNKITSGTQIPSFSTNLTKKYIFGEYV